MPSYYTRALLTTEETCHCGADFQGSDHCPWCGCERYEAYCDVLAPLLLEQDDRGSLLVRGF